MGGLTEECEKVPKLAIMINNSMILNPTVIKIPSDDRPMHFEEALSLTKFGKFNYFLIITSGIILAAVLLETLGISYVIPVSTCDMNLSTSDKGILSAIGFAGIISSSHLWGFLADTQGRRKIILPSLCISFVITVFSSFTKSFWLFILLRYLNGFFISGSSATIYAYLGEFHTVKQRSRAIMGASTVFGITCVLLPVLAWLVINTEWEFFIPILNIWYRPWRLFLIVCGLPSILCAICIYYMPESPKFILSLGKQSETIEILQQINRINNGKSVEPLKIPSIIEEVESVTNREDRQKQQTNKNGGLYLLKLMWSQTIPLFQNPNLKRTIIACTIQFGIYVSSNGMYMWFPEISTRVADFRANNPDKQIDLCQILDRTKIQLSAISKSNSSQLTEMVCTTQLEIATYEHSIVLELLYALGFALIGLVINRVGKYPILLIVMGGCGIAAILAVYIQNPIYAMYLYIILLMCGLAIPVVNAATVDLYPTNNRGMAICISLMMGRLGSIVGANAVGLLLDNHCQLTFILSGSLLIFCSLLALLIPNIIQRKANGPPKINMPTRHSICSYA